MKTSPNGLAFIAHWEGEVLHTYLDAGGKPTIGAGHLLGPGEAFPGGITHDQAMGMLAGDVGLAETAVNEYVSCDLTQEQFDALVSFTFNCGPGSLKHSTLLLKLNAGDQQGAADQFLQWIHVGGHVNAGLMARRRAERAMFLAGEA